MKKIKNSQNIVIELNAYTGFLNFFKNIFVPFSVDEIKLNQAIRHNIGVGLNEGIANITTTLPLKHSNILCSIAQTTPNLNAIFSYRTLDRNINGTYYFNIVLSGNNGAPLCNADIILFLEFIEYDDNE